MIESIKSQLDNTLEKIDLKISDDHYSGKVRENFYLDDKIVMITSDRVSAFDHILGTIPFKGQILNEIACFWFNKTKDIVPNHFISSPDEQVLITKKAKTLPVEVIVRQYITGSLWREYKQGINGQYGFMLPDNLKENQEFQLLYVTKKFGSCKCLTHEIDFKCPCGIMNVSDNDISVNNFVYLSCFKPIIEKRAAHGSELDIKALKFGREVIYNF